MTIFFLRSIRSHTLCLFAFAFAFVSLTTATFSGVSVIHNMFRLFKSSKDSKSTNTEYRDKSSPCMPKNWIYVCSSSVVVVAFELLLLELLYIVDVVVFVIRLGFGDKQGNPRSILYLMVSLMRCVSLL